MLAGVEVDSHVRGGLVVLRYPRFTVIELASPAGEPAIGKGMTPGAKVDPATVAGNAGFWIRGAHQIAYLDRRGNFETDTVRRSGPVLLWSRAGITFRIEGLPHLSSALAIARSIP